MADEPNSPVLEALQRIDLRTERMAQDIHDVESRLSAVEDVVFGITRRIDRLEERVERIERQLDPVDLH